MASCRGRVEPAVVQPELRVPGEHEGIFRDIYPEGLAPTAVERVSVWGERPCKFVPLTVCLVAHKKHGCVVVGSWSFEETCHSIGDDVLREYKVEGEVLFLAPSEEMQLQFVTADLGGRRFPRHGVGLVERLPVFPDSNVVGVKRNRRLNLVFSAA